MLKQAAAGLVGRNLVAGSILSRRALRGASITSSQEVGEAIDRFIAAYNPQAVPFEWTKREIRNVHPKRYYANLHN